MNDATVTCSVSEVVPSSQLSTDGQSRPLVVYFVRHAEAQHNVEEKRVGVLTHSLLNVPLPSSGRPIKLRVEPSHRFRMPCAALGFGIATTACR